MCIVTVTTACFFKRGHHIPINMSVVNAKYVRIKLIIQCNSIIVQYVSLIIASSVVKKQKTHHRNYGYLTCPKMKEWPYKINNLLNIQFIGQLRIKM